MSRRTQIAIGDVRTLLGSVAARLAEAGVESPRRVAQTLLSHVIGQDLAYLLGHPEYILTPPEAERFEDFVVRRSGGEPTHYLTGVREFFGRPFAVNPAVLIPRPETELLVEASLERLPAEARVLDLCTGSGCVALSLKLERDDLQVVASDISGEALALARRNARMFDCEPVFFRGDLLDPVRPNSLDGIVSNPPYVAVAARSELSREVLCEPEVALFAGDDGLDAYRRLIPQAEAVLRPGGLLALELGHDSLKGVLRLLRGWREIDLNYDLAGIARILTARRP